MTRRWQGYMACVCVFKGCILTWWHSKNRWVALRGKLKEEKDFCTGFSFFYKANLSAKPRWTRQSFNQGDHKLRVFRVFWWLYWTGFRIGGYHGLYLTAKKQKHSPRSWEWAREAGYCVCSSLEFLWHRVLVLDNVGVGLQSTLYCWMMRTLPGASSMWKEKYWRP